MRLEDIKITFLRMPRNLQEICVQHNRNLRINPTSTKAKEKAQKKAAPKKKKVSVMDAFAKASPQQQQEMLNKLKETMRR